MSNTLLPNRLRRRKPRRRLAADHLRGEQLIVLARWSGLTAACSMACWIMIAAAFWHTASHAYLLALLAALLGLHTAAMRGRRAWLTGGRCRASRRMLWVRIGVSAALATAWASAPVALMPTASPDQRQLLTCIAVGLISASVVLAPVLPMALLFAVTSAGGILLPILMLDGSIVGPHAVFIMTYALMTCGVVVIQSRDFVSRVLNESALAARSDIIGLKLRDFEENASDFLWETDAELRLDRVSGRLAQIMGCDPASLYGTSMRRWIEAGGIDAAASHDAGKLLDCFSDRIAFRELQVLLSFAGTERWLCLTGKPVLDAEGRFQGYRGVGSDVSSARRSDARIAFLARHDSLTGLPNRALFQDALAQACARSAPFAVLCLNLDGFKSVNDTLGRGVGDALLVAVAGRLRASLRESDVVARLGDDEFAVLQVGSDAAAATVLAQRLTDRVGESYQLGPVSTSIALSIGIAMPSDLGQTAEDVLRAADLALNQAKADGRGTWRFFETAMATRAQERHGLQVELRLAIERGELILDFQPIIDMESGSIIAAEALVRWQHPLRGRISPADFIPAAEEGGSIVALGGWVLRRACREAAGWAGNARVAVNLSPLQFRDPGLLALIDEALGESGLPPHRLELEITESVFLDALDTTVACLHALRSRGIHIALDDFGTGYSSLGYLRSFPFDKVKIDQSFVRDLDVNKDAIAIIRAIVGMAGSLGMNTTGEGVETASQARLLQLTGCTQAQGYLFSRPCPAEAIGRAMRCDQPSLSTLLSPVLLREMDQGSALDPLKA